jgi:glycosyltransferase involved in cell wall biosynthesis
VRREGPLRVLFVGGDFTRKGGDVLLDAFRRQPPGSCELDLVTATHLAPEPGVRVHAGLRPHSPELLALYASADVFVLPTRGDCLAVVLGEAMAACLPIITTPVGAHPEAVEEGRSGFIVDVDDVGALAHRLRLLAADRNLAWRMGMRSRQIGEERFDIVRGAGEIGDLLVRLARGDDAAAPTRNVDGILTESRA